jgi:hypothetical protein
MDSYDHKQAKVRIPPGSARHGQAKLLLNSDEFPRAAP